jgi:hypothetical protein
MRESLEKTALQALERELAGHEELVAANRRSRHRGLKRVLGSLILIVGIGAVALAIACSNFSINAFWRDWIASNHDADEIARLKDNIVELLTVKAQMAASIAALQAERDEIRAALQKQPEYYWYSYPPALHFRNPFPPRSP